MADDTAEVVSRSRSGTRTIIAMACLGQFLVVLDATIVNIALPSIRYTFGLDEISLQWVVNAYTITFSGFLMLGGRAADIFGQWRLFAFGSALFSVASLAAGLADGEATLVAARAFQGIGAAALSPATLTIITTTFRDPSTRGRALGLWSSLAGFGRATGALLGGLIVFCASWRWTFYINVLLGAACILGAWRMIIEDRVRSGLPRIDMSAALAMTGGLSSVVAGVVTSGTHGWLSAPVLAFLALGLVLLGVCAMPRLLPSRSAILPTWLFRIRSIAVSNIVMFLLAFAIFPHWYFLSLYVQDTLAYSALEAGLVFLPQAIMIAFAARLASLVLPRCGPVPPVVVGSAISAVGLLWLSRAPEHGSYLSDVMGPSFLVAFGIGLAFTPIAFSATGGVASTDSGLASGLLNTTRNVGGTLGLAVMVTVALGRMNALRAAGLPTSATTAAGYTVTFALSAAVAGAATLIALALPRGRPDSDRPGAVTASQAVVSQPRRPGAHRHGRRAARPL